MLRHRVPGLRPTAIVLVAALGSLGGPPLASAAAQEVAADPLAEAQALYERGRAKFETADYEAAIDLWTQAYAKVPDTPDASQIKVLLIYNIATAREKAFDVTQDPAQLRQAKILLGNFEKSIGALYGEGEEADAERERVQAKMAELDERLAAFDHPQEPDDGTRVDPPDDPPDDPPPEDPDPITDTPPDDGAAKGLVIGGAVALSLGVGGLAMMGAGLGMGSGANDITGLEPDDIDGRREQFDRGRTGNTIAIAGGVVGGVLVVAGGVLLGLGLAKKKKASAVALRPAVGPQGAGLTLRGRF